MNSTRKIILAFKLKLLLIIAGLACSLYINGKLTRDKAGENPDSHIASASGREKVDNTASINNNTASLNNTDTRESSCQDTKSSLSYYKVAGQGRISDRLYIEIIL